MGARRAFGSGHNRRNLGRCAMSNKMWGGRFRTSPDAVMEDINASVDFDRHLFRQDIAASQAHAAMLAKQGIITADDAAEIIHGLDTILSEIEGGKFNFKRVLEDIHMNVESRLAELIGPAAGRLHTARSRNDQVATDFRLWIRGTIDAIDDALAAAAIAAVHLSRVAEEIVIWCSPLCGLLLLSDRFTTGSSIMPQKRNPDAAELVRAKTGRIVGALQALLIVMKGLPLAYKRDMQEDKEGAMDAFSALMLSIAAMTGMVRDMTPDVAGMRQAATAGHSTATDLADWLVRTHDMPFREAHHVTGRIVAKAAAENVPLDQLPLAAMQAIEKRITKDAFAVLTVDDSVKSRASHGGTAPKNVRRQANRWLKALA